MPCVADGRFDSGGGASQLPAENDLEATPVEQVAQGAAGLFSQVQNSWKNLVGGGSASQ